MGTMVLFSGWQQCPECHEDVRYENMSDGAELMCWNCKQVFHVNFLRRELFTSSKGHVMKTFCCSGYDHVEAWANNFSDASIKTWARLERDPTPVEICDVAIVQFPINMTTHLLVCATCMHIVYEAVIERIALYRQAGSSSLDEEENRK